MGTTDRPVAVVDAGPFIHLDELGELGLLNGFGGLQTTRQVWTEVLRHRPSVEVSLLPQLVIRDIAQDAGRPEDETEETVFGLGEGEVSVLSLMGVTRNAVFLCDDAAARFVAGRRGFRVHGTVGVIIRSMRCAIHSQSEVMAILCGIPEKSSLHIRASLLDSVIKQVATAAGH